MFDKLFSWGKKEEIPEPEPVQPAISFGRYSDNNKTKAKTSKWTEADNLYKEKKYPESIAAFFDYLADDAAKNVQYLPEGDSISFSIHQGSKIIRGAIHANEMKAVVNLARMPQPGVAIMRRLLDQNFNLFYSRYALQEGVLCMRFDTDVNAASPSKLYYGLKELATRADKQDDLLIQDFQQLETIDTEHLDRLPETEKEIKYKYLQTWIHEVLDMIAGVDPEKFSGGNAYLLLTLVYRIDFLILPEGKLLRELEEIYAIYWKADNRPATEKNRDMAEAFKKMAGKSREEVFPYLFRSVSTFSTVVPTVYKTVAESIQKANENSIWYKTNGYPLWHNRICEYGIGFAQYTYSLPKPVTDLYLVFMQVNYNNFFEELGFRNGYVNNGQINREPIARQIGKICALWREKYPSLEYRTDNLNYGSLEEFNFSFCNELQFLNLDS
jgi:hypothetical protein